MTIALLNTENFLYLEHVLDWEKYEFVHVIFEGHHAEGGQHVLNTFNFGLPQDHRTTML